MNAGDLMILTDKNAKDCTCTGVCTGYSTRKECPPLIVIAVALTAQESAAST